MSRFDAIHERAFEKHLLECARDIVVGAKVYRANYSHIEEGVVKRVGRCCLRGDGDLEERDDGDHAYYLAQFGRYTCEAQTYQWKWFVSEDKAKVRLVEQLRRSLEDAQGRIRELEALIVTNSPSPNEVGESPSPAVAG